MTVANYFLLIRVEQGSTFKWQKKSKFAGRKETERIKCLPISNVSQHLPFFLTCTLASSEVSLLTLQSFLGFPELLQLGEVLVQHEDLGPDGRGHRRRHRVQHQHEQRRPRVLPQQRRKHGRLAALHRVPDNHEILIKFIGLISKPQRSFLSCIIQQKHTVFVENKRATLWGEQLKSDRPLLNRTDCSSLLKLLQESEGAIEQEKKKMNEIRPDQITGRPTAHRPG